MAEIRIISGAGRYADPWHDFPATSARIAAVGRELGHRVTIEEQVEEALADLRGVDLAIVNVGNPSRHGGETELIGAARDGLLRHLGQGRSLLSIHSSATSFPGMDSWEEIVGGRWVAGASMHPEIGQAAVRVRTGLHPVVEGLEDFTLHDERYSFLRVTPGIVPLAEHLHDGRMHPLLWAREFRPGRVVYDALGHGIESYDCAARVQLLRNELTWLTDLSAP